jgi:hypothetical protein
MEACCSHYFVTLLPAVGVSFSSIAAASVAEYQRYLFLAGAISNLFGIGLMVLMTGKSGRNKTA